MVRDLQHHFSALWPFLRLDFTAPSQGAGIATQSFFSETPLIAKPGISALDINGARTVAEVLADVQNLTSLVPELSRRAGQVWSLITLTEDWTLSRQNSEGAEISALFDEDGAAD